ncbi:MAG TPA: bifunctional diguanylate cyclase/phosphodiesterase [Alphaproteobacteria bacterium]|nr:bifunctional diguanylate cyclase/phosphodiesterase [Alphaproteobacteria bacterium]HOO50894.1 bifunctional diguanylate cyclase/phosphodiesterase [Alphaproteobacteria bacterium]
MSDSKLWLQHLSLSLRASRQVAYLYHVEDDKFEFIGDIMGVLGLPDDRSPSNREEFSKLLAESELVTRQLALAEVLSNIKTSEKNFTLRYNVSRADGTLIPLIETGVARYSDQEKKTTIQSLMALDVEKIEQQKRLARKMGFRNAVTNVFSSSEDRRQLLHAIENSIERVETCKGFLLLLGLDRMSLVNEIYGSEFADEMLHTIEEMLKQILKDQAKVYHIAGDIFALHFDGGNPGEMGAKANDILKVFYNQTIEVQERSIHQVVSIGGVRIVDQTVSASSVLSRAELALMDAKNKGRGCFIEYSDKLGEEVKAFRDILTVGDDFLRSFKDGRVKIAFQGIVNSRTNNISFHECLIRMIDEQGEVHTAGKFIGAIERMGLTRLVDMFATREAIKELKEFPAVSLSVNVSNHTFTDPDWLKSVKMELRDYPDVAQRLIVEITESVAMSDINQTMRVARTLQDLGCRIALDDFGAGQTAFSQLKDLSLDIVKIDKSFVREMDKEENKLFIRTLHSLASAMNLETVGEGAETLAEADILAKDGIDHIQGFVHGLPTLDRPWMNLHIPENFTKQ